METLGKTFLMVIDPENFDIKQQKVLFSDFGFVLVTQSKFFRDSMIKLCMECHRIRQKNFDPEIITHVRERMRDFVGKSIRTELEFLELVSNFFDIAYYTAVSHDNDAHLRKFITVEGINPKYFGYFGSKDYSSLQIINKIQGIIESQRDENSSGTCFEIYQVKN
ncbi:MAG: hypothetical protein ACXABO_18930 [Promethearchaeota archaeon]|jgi:hypothetical protein